MLTGIYVPIVIAAAFVAGSIVGAIFHRWFEKQAADAQAKFDKAVADAVARLPKP